MELEKRKIWKERLAFPSYFGEVPMEAVAWHPPGAPRAMLVLVHGMQEHVERYEHLAAALTRAGFLVCGYNQLGHGGSLLDVYKRQPQDLLQALSRYDGGVG